MARFSASLLYKLTKDDIYRASDADLDSLAYRIDSEQRELEKTEREISNNLLSNTLKQTAAITALSKRIQEAKNILLKNTEEAIKRSKEFDYDLFGPKLILAVSSDDIIIASVLAGKVIIKIDLDKTAGNLEEYGKVVAAARNKFANKKTGLMPALAASKLWYEKIYSVDRLKGKVTKVNKKTGESKDVTAKYRGKYRATVEERVSNFSKLAPWWRLLEYGNIFIKIPGSRGGYAGPAVPATHFVRNSEKQIADLLQEDYRKEYDKLYRNADARLKKVRDKRTQLNRVYWDIVSERSRRRFERQAPAEKIAAYKRTETRSKIIAALGEKRYDAAVYSKLSMVIDRLVEGEKIDRIRLGHGVRVRLTRLSKQLEQEYRKIEAMFE